MDEKTRRLRDLHSETDAVLCDMEGLLNALEIAMDAHPTLIEANPASSAIFTVLRLLKRSLDEMQTARRMEWVALGGSTSYLTDEQIAAARGE